MMPDLAVLPFSVKVAVMPDYLEALHGLALKAGLALAASHHGHRLIRLLGLIIIVALVLTAVWLLVRWLGRGRRVPGTAVGRAGKDDEGGHAGLAVDARHLTKTHQMGRVAVRALDDVSVQIGAGAMACVMGKSGSGKSTLLRQLSLIDRPGAGRIWLHGQEVTGLAEKQRGDLRLRRLGYVFQEYALLPELTAAENVCLPAMMAGQRGRACRRRAAELLELVGLAPRAGHLPRELSGGEQQRVAIARALVNEPQVIFADEPTASLDSASAATVMQTLRALRDDLGVTVVFVSHDPDDAQYATQLIHLADGRVTSDSAAVTS
jgi:putative ABC transport system ATP-binding protein